MTPYVRSTENMDGTATDVLERKLMSLITANGFGSISGDFVLVGNVNIVESGSTPTVPVKYYTEVETELYALNLPGKAVIMQKLIVTKGVGRSLDQAFLNALKQINVNRSDLRKFMDIVRTRIVDYYEAELPRILAESKMLESRGEFGQALAVLGEVPSSVPGYDAVLERMTEVYVKSLDREAEVLLHKVDIMMVSGDHNGALNLLSQVDPASTLFSKASSKVMEIRTTAERKKLEELVVKAESCRKEMERDSEYQEKCSIQEQVAGEVRNSRKPVSAESLDAALQNMFGSIFK